MENLNAESFEKEYMEKNLNDEQGQQTDIQSNYQSIPINSNASEKSDIHVVGTEDEEVQKTYQRRPQFRFNENNKRRFF